MEKSLFCVVENEFAVEHVDDDLVGGFDFFLQLRSDALFHPILPNQGFISTVILSFVKPLSSSKAAMYHVSTEAHIPSFILIAIV